jgi:hypothetical protein
MAPTNVSPPSDAAVHCAHEPLQGESRLKCDVEGSVHEDSQDDSISVIGVLPAINIA